MDSMRCKFAAMVVVLGAASAMAQAQQRFQLTEYSAKFLCGVVEDRGPGSPVQPGTYSTSINIHNAEIVTPVTFVKKVVLAPVEPVAQKEPVPPSRFRRDQLKPDFAEYVDCKPAGRGWRVQRQQSRGSKYGPGDAAGDAACVDIPAGGGREDAGRDAEGCGEGWRVRAAGLKVSPCQLRNGRPTAHLYPLRAKS